MALKIRLRMQGRKNRSLYRLVLTESRSPRDGKYIELLGWYNPLESDLEKMVSVQADRVAHWLSQGAIVSENAERLISKSCPSVIADYHKRLLEKKRKECEKRKASKKQGAPKAAAAKKAEVKTEAKAKKAPAAAAKPKKTVKKASTSA